MARASHYSSLSLERMRMFVSIITHYRLPLCLLLSAWLLAACSGNSKESRKCAVGLANAPEIRGLRLGMSGDEFKAKFPLTINPARHSLNPNVNEPDVLVPDRFGVINVPNETVGFSSTEGDANNPQLKGVEIRQAFFVDGHLAHFRVAYRDDTVKWENLAQFVVRTSESLGLSCELWKPKDNVAKSFFGPTYDYDNDVGGFINQEVYLDCDDVVVVAGFLSGKRHDGGRTPFIQMDDLKAVRAVAERENKWEAEEKLKKAREEEQRREAFKP
jgi:hypothetical protein